MKSFTVKSYWDAYKTLPVDIQNQAERKYELWKLNPFYPSLQFNGLVKSPKVRHSGESRSPESIGKTGFRLSPE